MNSGACTEGELEDVSELVAGPEGSLLVTRAIWSEDMNDYDTVTIKISKMDPATLSEEALTEIKVKGDSRSLPCLPV